MWIILLDKSGSMHDPFSGLSEFKGHTRITQKNSKIDAAKEALLDYLGGMGTPVKVSIVAFDTNAKLVFAGTSIDIESIKIELDKISPEGGTSISNALEFVRNYISGLHDVRFCHLLVISDGLSELDPARQAAQNLTTLGTIPIFINVFLIDVTDEGEEVARAIAVNGNVQAISNLNALKMAVNSVGDDAAKRALQEGEQAIEHQLSDVNPETNKVEKLNFTTSYPGKVAVDVWYPMYIYLHTERHNEHIEKLIGKDRFRLGSSPNTGKVSAKVARESTITLIPVLDNFVFNPPKQDIIWYEDIHKVDFRLSAKSTSSHPSIGRVDVYAKGVLVASIPLSVITDSTLDDFVENETSEYAVAKSEVFNSIFISYAHKNQEIIDACVAVYDSLGIDVYIDNRILKAGQDWNEELLDHIERADLFQLYWSHSASVSKYVKREWVRAKEISDRIDKDARFIRPLVWENNPPRLPDELKHIQYSELDLSTLSLQPKEPLANLLDDSSKQPVQLYSCVLPILPGISTDSMRRLILDKAVAINFLEDVTGLRYYPVSTILVDNYLVKNIRQKSVIAPDIVLDEALGHQVKHISSIIQRIHLALHIGTVFPPEIDDDIAKRNFGIGKNVSEEQYSVIHRLCEYMVNSIARELVEPEETKASVDNDELLAGVIHIKDDLTRVGFVFDGNSQTQIVKQFLEIVNSILVEGSKSYTDHVVQQVFSPSEVDYLQSLGFDLPQETMNGLTLQYLIKIHESTSDKFVNLLDQGNIPISESLHFLSSVPTYGLYTSIQNSKSNTELILWASQRKLPPQTLLNGQPKVLFCQDEQEKFASQLTGEKADKESDLEETLEGFRRCVLIHEHFHAILEVGVDSNGKMALDTVKTSSWADALPLNESLAVWMELHFVREQPNLNGLVREYISYGDYPEWPYQGALTVESIFKDEGIDGIRNLITELRKDPDSAQERFDKLVESNKS